MSIYSPDAWVVVKLSGDAVPDGVLYKILAGWKGGYTQGDSWKLNSGITKIEETEHVFNVYGYSGSIYSCYKESERMMMITQGIFDNLVEAYKNKKVKIEIVPMNSILEQFKNQ